jgi:integrase
MRARLPASPPTKATIGSDYARNCAKKALTRLRAHKRRLDPPRDTWPVFQTTHLASLYDALPEDADASPDTVDELLREHGVTPPSISVNTARNVLERLCLESGIRQGGEILKPHGARRGLGDQIYHEASPQDAQSLLRHKSIETTHRHYEQDDTERTRTALDGVLGDSAGEQ